MNRNHFAEGLGALVLLSAMIACMLPGRTVKPTPVIPYSVQTSVAGTAEVTAKQTEQAGLVTSTPMNALTEHLPSQEVISSSGTSLVKLEDGSTQFKDYRAGIQILFPPHWMPIRVGESEYYAASEKWGAKNAWFLEEIGSIQNLDVNLFRLNAYDTEPTHLFYGTFPKINVVFHQGDTRTLKQVEADEKRLIANSVKSGHKFLSSSFQETSNSLPVLVFQSEWKAQSYDMTHHIGTFFKVPTGIVFIDFYIPSDHKDAVEAERAQIVESITLFTP
jgi:hypothetical protein